MSGYHPEPSFFPDTCDSHYRCDGSRPSPAMSKLNFCQDDVHERQQLPQDLLDMVDSLLQDEPFPLHDYPTTNLLDLQLGAASPWLDPDPLNVEVMMGSELVDSRSGEVPPGPSLPRTKRPSSKTKRRQRCSDVTLGLPTTDVHLPQHPPLEDHLPQHPPLEDHLPQHPPLEDHLPQHPPLEDHLPQHPPLEDHLPQHPPLEDHLPQHPPLEELGVASGDATARPRRRRPRVSYSTLTEEEKYQRIRELNNEASKGYRQRRRQELSQLEQHERHLRQRNAVLQTKMNGLLELKDHVEDYFHNLLANTTYRQDTLTS